MSFSELFKIYPNRNSELRYVARQAYEAGFTIAQEPSAGMSFGLDEHAIIRQKAYVTAITLSVNNLKAKAVPDRPAVHPIQFPINMSVEYSQFTEDLSGEQVPINEATQLLSEHWMTLAVTIANSQSAALAGSFIGPDHSRAINELEVITQLIKEIEDRPQVDLPETARPGASLGKPSGGSN